MNEQLDLFHQPSEEPTPNPNAHMFDEDGSPKRLLWCSDTVRIAFNRGEDAPCPYTGERARFRPAGGCCKDLATPPEPPRRTALTELPGTTFEDIFAGPPSRVRSAA